MESAPSFLFAVVMRVTWFVYSSLRNVSVSKSENGQISIAAMLSSEESRYPFLGVLRLMNLVFGSMIGDCSLYINTH